MASSATMQVFSQGDCCPATRPFTVLGSAKQMHFLLSRRDVADCVHSMNAVELYLMMLQMQRLLLLPVPHLQEDPLVSHCTGAQLEATIAAKSSDA